jgi:hypothetical protein
MCNTRLSKGVSRLTETYKIDIMTEEATTPYMKSLEDHVTGTGGDRRPKKVYNYRPRGQTKKQYGVAGNSTLRPVQALTFLVQE